MNGQSGSDIRGSDGMTEAGSSGAPTLSVWEIRPFDMDVEWVARIDADVAWLGAQAANFVPVACPACGVADPSPHYVKNGVRHVVCNACATQYVSPRAPEAMMTEFYRRSKNYEYWSDTIYAASEAPRREKIFKPRLTHLLGLLEQRGVPMPTLIEVGAGYGVMCDEAVRSGRFGRVIGIEPTPKLAAVCRSRGLEVIEQGYEQVDFDGMADAIVAYEVMEHLFSPEKFVAWARRALKPGGLLILTCPGIEGFDIVSQGELSPAVDHQHINLFTDRGIRILLQRFGFKCVETDTPGKLDAEIAAEGIRNGKYDAVAVGSFLASVLATADSRTLGLFQKFLVAARRSSHLRVVAHAP